MKIALLAPSNAGKTVYLTGLYGVLTRDNNEDSTYPLHFKITNKVKAGFLEDRYTDLLEQGKFGDPSKSITVYPGSLSIINPHDKTKRSLDIEIVDFPGEALYRASEDSQKEYEKITEALSQCDGFIVLVDGETLIKGVDKKDIRILQNRMRANAVKEVLTRALDRRRAHKEAETEDPDGYSFGSGPTPVAFAVTKGDMIDQWFANENAGASLNQTVRNLFGKSAQANGYNPQEGEIANLIRSQYGQIIDAPDVVSARTCVQVFNEKEGMFDPKRVEDLFQFVLFQGLRNAVAAYDSRLSSWKKDLSKKDKFFASEKAAYERAESARKAFVDQNLFFKVIDIVNGESGIFHNDRVEKWHGDMVKAGKSHDKTLLSVQQTSDNRNTAFLFQVFVLHDRLAYLINGNDRKQGMYHQNLDVSEFKKEDWWKNKVSSGKKLHESQSIPQASNEPG